MMSFLLAGCAGGARSVPALIRALKSGKPEVRADAARRLGEMGPEAAPAVPSLVEALKDRNVSVFRAAGDALVHFSTESAPALTAMGRDPSAWVRCRAVETLGRFASSPELVPVFMKAMEDHDQCVHDKAVDALGRAGGPAVPSLVGSLKSPNPAMRRAASEALSRMPAETRERAAFPIIQQLRGKDEYSRGEAELLLSEMGRPAAPSLIPLLDDPEADLRRRAVVILGRIGVADDAVVKGLTARLADSDRLVRLNTAMSLGELGETDARVLPILLMRLTSEKSSEIRRGLIASIGNMGLSARDAVGPLISLLSDGDKEVREESSESLMKIGTLEAMDAVERRNRGHSKENETP